MMVSLRLVLLYVSLCLVLAVVPAIAQKPLPASNASGANALAPSNLEPRALPGPASDTLIHPDDVLDINILDVPELSRQYRISPAGTVLFPLIATPMHASGMRVTEFSAALTKELHDRGLVTNAQVLVSIVASRAAAVAITGAIKLPQIYPVFGETTLLDVLSQAQGLTDDAGNVAVISRGDLAVQADRSQPITQTVDLTKLLQSGDAKFNVKIYAGDRITVPRAGIVYVVGAVNKPGGYTIKSAGEGMTVLQAIALAEDLKSTAKRDKTVVIRPDPGAPGGHQQTPLNLKKILAGKAEDPILQANDILFVPDSQGAKALHRGLEAALQAATLVAVYRP